MSIPALCPNLNLVSIEFRSAACGLCNAGLRIAAGLTGLLNHCDCLHLCKRCAPCRAWPQSCLDRGREVWRSCWPDKGKASRHQQAVCCKLSGNREQKVGLCASLTPLCMHQPLATCSSQGRMPLQRSGKTMTRYQQAYMPALLELTSCGLPCSLHVFLSHILSAMPDILLYWCGCHGRL